MSSPLPTSSLHGTVGGGEGQQRSRSGTPVTSRSSLPDMKSYLLEKETLESQMRKLSLENSTLQMENKLIKDKYNRSVARVTELETKLQESQDEVNDLQAKLEEESGRVGRSVKASMEREIEQSQARAASASKEVQILKSEVTFLEEQLSSARRETETLRHSMDKSKAHDAHMKEIDSFKTEISHLKRLLEESEQALETESTRCKDLSTQVQKLTEVKDILQMQLEEGSTGGNTAEKRVASLEMRLRVTEERLAQERADRAGNLSQIEEKLLSENAKLQTKNKELERQLKREKEKTRTLEQRANEFREENLQLRLAMPDEDEKDYDLPYSRHASQRHDNKKPAYDIKQIMKQLESESGLTLDQGDRDPLILYLWEQRQDLQHKVKEWKLYLKQLELSEGEEGVESLQSALAIKTEYEAKWQETEEKCEDISAERIAAEQTYKQQLTDLVKERHEAFARLKTLEDLMDALRAENETLRQGLATTTGQLEVKPGSGAPGEGQIEALHDEISSLEVKISQHTRRNKVLESEISTLREQLASRDKELTETFAELKTAQAGPKSNAAEDQVKQQRLQSLTLEVASLKEELRHQAECNTAAQTEKHKLETEIGNLKDQLKLAKKQNREQDLGTSMTKKLHLEKMEAELERKDGEILKLTSQFNDKEASLHIAKSELALQKKIQEDMEAQMEAIQQQLDQRCQVLDALSAKENDQLEQLDMVKGMIHTLNQGLSQKQGEMEVMQLELQQAKEKIAWLEEQKAKLTARVEESGQSGMTTTKHSPAATDLRVSEMEMEKDELKAQMLQTANDSLILREECETLNAEVIKVKQERSTAQTESTKLASDKALLETRMKTLEEERQMMRAERDTCKEDLVKLETSLHEVVGKFEEESKEKYDNFTTEYHDDSPQGQKLIGELQTLRLLTFAKEKENGVMMDKVRRQEQELKNGERKCELLQRESEQSRQDVTRITHELVLKMKENAATMEVNRVLLREQTGVQRKLGSTETQLKQERERTEKRKAEVADVIKKIEQSEQTQLSTSLTLQQKDSIISDQEGRLRQLSRDLDVTEAERDSLRTKVDQLTEDVRSLSNVNTELERKLETKQAALQEDQSALSKQKEESISLSHKLEALKHEQNLLLGNLSTERKVQEKLKEEIKTHEEYEKRQNEKIAELTRELETQKGHLVASRETINQTKAEKETFMKDYHDACRRLGEKETELQEVQKKNVEEITCIKQESLQLSQAVSFEKASTERDMGQLKEEVENLKQQLQRKDEQISSFGQTLRELEDAKRRVTDLESYNAEQNKIAAETKILIESLRKELMSVRDQNAEQQETIARKEVVILDLKDQLRSSGESTETQVTEMRHTIDGMRSHHEYEKKTLRDALNKVEENLKASVQEVRTLMDTRDQLTEQAQAHDRALAEVNYKLSQEVAARKLAEEKLEQLRETVDEVKRKKAVTEEKVNSLQMSLNKAESDYSVVRERAKNLTSQLKDVEMALGVSEGAVKAGEEKIEHLKADLVRHQQMLENHKQQSTNKLRKLNLDLKQQVESQEQEAQKVNHQAHQLSVDLEQARETLALKNKENLKLQEKVLELEGQVRDEATKVKHMQDTLKHEEEMQTRLSYRFEEQESELKKLRNFLAKKADEDGDGKGMWQEMNRVISELSRQLQFHIETSRLLDQSGRDDSELVHKLRRSLLEAESQLNTERALHAVTRSSMQALEEDCTRLRQTIHAMRRRGAKTEKKQKSRMEEINEIIARSQTRAQALMASGEFSNMIPSRDYNVGDGKFSPDTSIGSDTSFSSANLANLSFLNLSGTYGAFTPRK